jgi:Clp amino terminal domain, pathogenicity island component
MSTPNPVQSTLVTSMPPGEILSRFSQPLAYAISKAQQENQGTGNSAISPEQILLGILSLGQSSNAAKLLARANISPQNVIANMPVGMSGLSWPPPPATSEVSNVVINLSPEGIAVINAGINCAKQFGHARIGTEHILLGMLNTPNSLANDILARSGVTFAGCRDAMGSWLVSGEYTMEPQQQIAPTTVATPGLRRASLVIQARNWAGMGYVVGIVVIYFLDYVAPGFGGMTLSTARNILGGPLLFFIWPYFFSSYALSWLLRRRYELGLVGQPRSVQFKALAFPMSVNVFLGLIISAGALVGAAAVAIESARWMGAGPEAAIGVLIAVVMELAIWTMTVTHWLLTFDVR